MDRDRSESRFVEAEAEAVMGKGLISSILLQEVESPLTKRMHLSLTSEANSHIDAIDI